jgi:dTDP-4-dehydrorhamnose reductase
VSIRQSAVQLWGGVECTINRVGDTFYDQCAWTGHRERVEKDLEQFAELGLTTLRAGLPWEHFAKQQNWTFADRCLHTMGRLGMFPIVGLLHHGSGPETTSLLDPAFPEKLAAYALDVARRYPWVTDYTPINEPQTTGRFACLYRHWYPHHACMHSYVRALLNQMKGIVLSMEAVRSVQPAARLLHTEDGGVTFSSARLEEYRVEREHRRWLGLDLLCGRVTREHPLFHFLLSHGASEREIEWFEERGCAPDAIGLNYYVTSDRYLDDRLDIYPPFMRGGDTGLEPLVDVEAVRVRRDGIAGVKTVLMDAWERYRLPLTLTEAHLGCEPAEQVRWLAEAWHGAQGAMAAGAEIRAVTAWGLLGLYNWSHLCTRDTGAYEPGVFDVSLGLPAETELTALVRQMAAGEPLRHPALKSAGWWRKDSRMIRPEPVESSFDPQGFAA